MKLLKVYSHPRSGTHYLEAFLAKNFYAAEDLLVKDVEWGHWSNRKKRNEGNEFGKLFGNHYLPDKSKIDSENPATYIYRDGRAVLYSLWKTPNFVHPSRENDTFSEFLKKPLDWIGSPGNKDESGLLPAEHWKSHTEKWLKTKNPNLMLIRYEDMIASPEKIAADLIKKFGFLGMPTKIDPIRKSVGLLPNKATIDSWQENYSKNDIDEFFKIVPANYWGLFKPESIVWKIKNRIF